MAAMPATSRATRIVIVFAWIALLTFWSSLNSLPFDRPAVAHLVFGFQHRVIHVIAFGTLGLLARWAFDGLPRASLLAILWASAFGAADEIHQIFTPLRHPGLDDWLVDTLAAALAMLAWPRLIEHRALVRRLAPAAVAGLFVVGTAVGVGAATLGPRLPGQIRRVTVQVVPPEATQAARDLARSTRSLVSHL
jgi:VanZ family protein